MGKESIKKNILSIDRILVGSVLSAYKQCGKANCQCNKGKKYWHGPYYVWTRKENGKTITKSLSQQQALFCQNAIKNMRKLNAYIKLWKADTLKQLDKIVGN